MERNPFYRLFAAMAHAKRAVSSCRLNCSLGTCTVAVVVIIGRDGIKRGEGEQRVFLVGVSRMPELHQDFSITIARGAKGAIGVRRHQQGRSDLALEKPWGRRVLGICLKAGKLTKKNVSAKTARLRVLFGTGAFLRVPRPVPGQDSPIEFSTQQSATKLAKSSLMLACKG